MRTGAAAGHTGYFHEACIYESDEQMLEYVVPFLEDGLAAGEPTIVACGPEHVALLRQAMPDFGQLTFLDGGDRYARPSSAIKAYREMLGELTASGAEQIRILGELPPAAWQDDRWPWWARYEAAVNHAYNDFPLWTMCAYPSDVPPIVLDDLRSTHPHVATADGGARRNDGFVDPARFLTAPRSARPCPLQRNRPLLDLADPAPATARRAVRDADASGELPGALDLPGLLLAVSEAITNALQHGGPAIRLRLWAGTERVVVEVSDRGSGPADPYVGLMPPGPDAAGATGLWLIHELSDHVGLERDTEDGGFTVRLTFDCGIAPK